MSNATSTTSITTTTRRMLEITAPSLIPGTHNLDNYLDSIHNLFIIQILYILCILFLERLVVCLRDGRKLFGILRTFDQFQNIVLQDTYERFYVELEYAEEYRGVFLVRGENIVLVGEIDDEEWQNINRRMSKFRRPVDQIMGRWKRERKELLQMRMTNNDSEMADDDAY